MASPDNDLSPYSGYFAPHRDYAATSKLRRARDGVASIYSRSARQALRRLIEETKPDVAHLHNIYHQLTLSVVDELDAHVVPTIMTLHDYKIVCPSYTLFTEGAPCRRCVTGSPVNAIRHRCIKDSVGASTLGAAETAIARARGTYRKIDALIAPSKFLGDLATTRTDPSRVHVLPNFLPVSKLEKPMRAKRREAEVLFAGRLEMVKGIEPLIRAFSGPGTVRLAIAGDGPLRPKVQDAAAREPRIEYLGRLDQTTLADRMQRSLAVVVPSLWEENCPMTIIEARVAGTPVICAASGGLPELVDDGVDGLLFDPHDPESIAAAANRLADEPSTLSAMADAGQARFTEHHSPDAHLRALLSIYETAIEVKQESLTWRQ